MAKKEKAIWANMLSGSEEKTNNEGLLFADQEETPQQQGEGPAGPTEEVKEEAADHEPSPFIETPGEQASNDSQAQETASDGAQSQETRRHRGAPRKGNKGNVKVTEEENRRVFVLIKKDLYDKIEALSLQEDTTIRDVLNQAIETTIARYEKRYGIIKPIQRKPSNGRIFA